MTKKVVRVFAVIFGVLLLVYLAYQFYMIAYPSYKTEVAIAVTVRDSVDVNGIVVRDETVVENSTGIVNFLVNDGDKVALGAAVAEVYDSAETARNNLRLSLLQEELDALQAASGLNRTSGANIDSVSGRVHDKLSELGGSVAQEEYQNLYALRNELITLLGSFSVSAGRTVDYSARIAELSAQIAACQGASSAASAVVNAPVEGFFISTTDGFETRIDNETLETMSVEELQTIVADAEQNATIDTTHSKIVSDYKWNYAAVISAKQAQSFKVGGTYSVDFNYALVKNLPMTVTRVSDPDASGNCLVVLECNRLNSSITALRAQKATINFTQYEGIKISRAALRLQDGQEGVYIKYGSTVEFRAIDKVYETDEFLISRQDASDDTLLALYDEVIVEGKDIYGGKELGN